MSDPRTYEWRGKWYTIRQLCEMSGMSKVTMYSRLERYGWSTEKAMTTPVDTHCWAKKEEKPKKKPKKKKEAVCTKRCKGCRNSESVDLYVYCMYADKKGHRRGCPAGKDCTKFERKGIA